MQEAAFLTLHGSNLEHLMNSHLRGCLQAVSVHWQYISPHRRKHFCHARRGTSAAAPAEAIPQQAGTRLVLAPWPQHCSARLSNGRGDPWLTGGGLHAVLLKSGCRFGTEGLLLWFHLEAISEHGKKRHLRIFLRTLAGKVIVPTIPQLGSGLGYRLPLPGSYACMFDYNIDFIWGEKRSAGIGIWRPSCNQIDMDSK